MKIPVHMSAYGSKDDIRTVEIPDDEINSKTTIQRALELTFKYGQNDIQPEKHPSVSVGDVVELNNRYFICLNVGWHELKANEFKSLPDNMASKHKLLIKMHDEMIRNA